MGGVLPEREGITDNTARPEPEETKIYETDEYVESWQEEGGIPAQLPEGATEGEMTTEADTALDESSLPEESRESAESSGSPESRETPEGGSP